MVSIRRSLRCLAPVCLALGFAGCGAHPAPSGSIEPLELRGQLHGGQQPVSGATIQLFAAGTGGYATGAVSLLSAPVVTDAEGGFTLTGNYTCPSAKSELYLVGTGGNPGLAPGTKNSALSLMAALGPCELLNGSYTLDPSRFISLNEVTTVAAAYALAGFMDPATTAVGTSPGNATGLANAFAAVNNLVDTTTGAALATTPAGNGVAPQATINTLADILAACVSSNGTGAPCSTLFAAATPSGGTAPTNTLQAALSIATHPVSQVAALYGLVTPTSPFQPALSTAPGDWVLALTYKDGGLQDGHEIAIDAQGNIWVPSSGVATLSEFSNLGQVLSGPTGYPVAGLSIAIDLNGNAWLPSGKNNVIEISASGSVLSGPNGFSVPGLDSPRKIAIDGNGHLWIGNFGGIAPPSVYELASDGSLLSPPGGFTAGAMNSPYAIAIDASEDVWVANIDDANLSKLSPSGAALSGSTGFPPGLDFGFPDKLAIDANGNTWVQGGGLTIGEVSGSGAALSPSLGFSICMSAQLTPTLNSSCQFSFSDTLAMDGSGNLWTGMNYMLIDSSQVHSVISGRSAVVELSNAGAILTGPVGVQPGALAYGMGVDSSGDLWGVNPGNNTLIELIGVATPAETPLSAAVRDGKLGARP